MVTLLDCFYISHRLWVRFNSTHIYRNCRVALGFLLQRWRFKRHGSTQGLAPLLFSGAGPLLFLRHKERVTYFCCRFFSCIGGRKFVDLMRILAPERHQNQDQIRNVLTWSNEGLVYLGSHFSATSGSYTHLAGSVGDPVVRPPQIRFFGIIWLFYGNSFVWLI